MHWTVLARLPAITTLIVCVGRNQHTEYWLVTIWFGPVSRCEAVGEIGETLARLGLRTVAKQRLDDALQLVNTMGLSGQATRATAALALAYAKGGFDEDALRITRETTRPNTPYARRASSLSYAASGDTSKALQEAYLITAGDMQARALRDVAITLAKNGDCKGALVAAQGIRSDAGSVLHRLASQFVALKEFECFKKLLLPTAFFPGSAYVMIGL